MSDLLIPGAQQRWFPHGSQRFYAAGGNSPAKLSASNPKIILHTTEGTGWTDYAQGAKAPTFTINPWTKAVQQHMPLQYGSRALRGSIAINASGVQVEIVGCTVKAWAAKIKRPDLYIGNFGDDEYAYLARVFADVQRLCGIPNVTTVAWPLAAATKGDETYGNTKWRLSLSQWNAARGFVGHLHAPGNVHSDPGCLDVPRLIRAIDALGGSKPTPAPTPVKKPVAFPLPAGHYYGVDDRTVYSHSGVRGNDSAWVKKIQAKVGAGVDGIFGVKTAAAVKKWQAEHKLTADSKVGPATWASFGFTA